ncbi:MAG: sigma-70 family RNA polymerase sigma factor [Mesorhizobium sp.]|nr:sigma-70 family RNA polymerase sigma factor [Mesorhizobium sp. M1B.F.Ca.ET.045.04.1.1]RWB18523.1 MAG: sigma-70 family RNA polymerase sigma factor [Mesorhizobium sp.]RWD99550.1 MAG: sigma-70 family RNA polymerase sigma factor [Mesorhizobium sp.]TIT88200.1 MAG: sigma-70 family RNA polymerase sigma factor [Mesorhizobium sp.]
MFFNSLCWGRAVLPNGHAAPDCAPGEISVVDLIPALRAFARTFCRVPDDADDLVQETLTKGLANLDKFEPGTRLKSWLFTIMRNTHYTRVKAAAREAPGLLDCASSRPISEASQEWFLRSKEVYRAIQKLPEHQREVLMLIGVLGVSYEETAEICDCAVGTVKSRLNRARAHVLGLLNESSSQSLVERHDHFLKDCWDRGTDEPR